jgi:DNA-binding NtrC family response regulator
MTRMDKAAILIFEPAESWHQIIAGPLLHHGLNVIQASQIRSALQLVQEERAGAVLLGPSTADSGSGLELARLIRQSKRTLPLLLIASNSSEELAIAALRTGINDYVRHPFCSEELTDAVRRCLSLNYQHTTTTRESIPKLTEGEQMVGESAGILRVKAYLAKVAATDTNLLITGETGTGKELAARLVHSNSNRRREPMVTINCAAVPDSLFESELFGYERGAFTGAQHGNEGKLKAGEGGTVFLDEIGDMSAYAQAKMLRVIDSKEIDRLGGRPAVSLNVRFIAATNQDLEQLVKEGRFRKDLFFRLNVARIHLPPLRDRREDISPLFDYYIQALNARFGVKVRQLTEEALEHLLAHDWPGNVRELKNLLEAVFVNISSAEISLDALPLEFRARGDKLKASSLDERERLLCALLSTNWNKSKAADKLHCSRMTLYRKLARFNIVRMDRGTEVQRLTPGIP